MASLRLFAIAPESRQGGRDSVKLSFNDHRIVPRQLEIQKPPLFITEGQNWGRRGKGVVSDFPPPVVMIHSI
eukprot:750997-Hanusia_phi.AAC.1